MAPGRGGRGARWDRASKKSVAASGHRRSCMCILPPHSRMMPMMRGCGMALLMDSALVYSSFSFFVFFCAVKIWISSAYTSSSCVPFFRSSPPASRWQDLPAGARHASGGFDAKP